MHKLQHWILINVLTLWTLNYTKASNVSRKNDVKNNPSSKGLEFCPIQYLKDAQNWIDRTNQYYIGMRCGDMITVCSNSSWRLRKITYYLHEFVIQSIWHVAMCRWWCAIMVNGIFTIFLRNYPFLGIVNRTPTGYTVFHSWMGSSKHQAMWFDSHWCAPSNTGLSCVPQSWVCSIKHRAT